MIYFSWRAPSLIGLTLARESLRIAKLKKTGRGFRVEQLSELVLPLAKSEIDYDKNQWDQWRDPLKTLIEQEGWQGMSTAICVSLEQVHIERLRLPDGLKEAEVEAEIKFKITHELPLFANSPFLDFKIGKEKE